MFYFVEFSAKVLIMVEMSEETGWDWVVKRLKFMLTLGPTSLGVLNVLAQSADSYQAKLWRKIITGHT